MFTKRATRRRQREEPDGREEVRHRYGLHGDLPTRLLTSLLKVVPGFLEPVFVYPVACVIVGLAGEQRRAVAGNLSAVPGRRGASGWLLLDVYRVFVQFGWVYLEGVRAGMGQCALDWEVEGEANLDALGEVEDGALIMTGHMANYDIAASIFASRIGRVFHIVRAREQSEELEELRSDRIGGLACESPLLRVHYSAHDMALGVELARALEKGEVVAVQADRAHGHTASMCAIPGGGGWMGLPRGPFMLASIPGTRVFPLFVVRVGRRRYRVIAFPPFESGGAGKAEGRFVRCLFSFLEDYWSQWFMFEEAFQIEGEEEVEGEG